jgi:hypothetical protein
MLHLLCHPQFPLYDTSDTKGGAGKPAPPWNQRP